MKLLLRVFICFIVLLAMAMRLHAQRIAVSGKITDASTKEPVNYATVSVKGTSTGTNSNFDGLYHLEFTRVKDSLTFSSIGYLPRSVYVGRGQVQNINVQLLPSSKALREVVIGPKGYVNPAWPIMRQVVRHKPENDPRKLKSYRYESYNRIELDASHLSKKLLSRKMVGRVLALSDSVDLTDADHLPVLPLFLSETVSDYYFRNSPEAKKEIIKKTQTKGVGFEDGTLLAQLTGSTFLQYNFYKDFVSALGKDFASPISDGWKSWYDYELDNSDAVIDGIKCFQISFKPKRPQDLAFTGTIWITKDTYALYQINATIAPSANLNFINRIVISQQMDVSGERPWLPGKTRILVEISQVTKNSSGLLAKLYTVNKNRFINELYPDGFFKDNIMVNDTARVANDDFWNKNRPDSLTVAERSVYNLIDSVRSIPVVKNYLTIADILINGYIKDGKISLGPVLNTYSLNNIEGNRLRVGFRTNSSFSNRIILGGYAAFGTKDLALKYGANADYILSRKHWTEAGISYSHDLNQVGLLSDAYLYQRNNLFAAFTRFGVISKRRVFYQDLSSAYLSRDLFKGFTERVTFNNWSLNPLFPFQFATANGGTGNQLYVSEVQLETKWSPGSQPIETETVNRQLNVKANVSLPVLTFRYTRGLKNVFGSDFNYQKFSFNVTQILKTGRFGRGNYSFSAGYIPSSVPYPLLENHLGNETFVFNANAFNLMRFSEFVSDKYASLSYTQHFEGLLFNSLPIISKLKWRLVGGANILYGSLSADNQRNLAADEPASLRGLGSTPYVEANYGIENIFRFVRIDFIHRLTYRDNYTVQNGLPKNFGIKVSAQIRL